MKRAILALALGLCQLGAHAGQPSRIVSVGGSITEVIFALDAGGRLAGVDITSRFPEAATRLPQVGYLRALSAEGVLSLRPDLVVTTDEAGPPAALEQMRDAGAELLVLPEQHSIEGVKTKIRRLAEVLGKAPAGDALVKKLEQEALELEQRASESSREPRVLFLMAAGQGTPLAAGKNTAADAMIALAGGRNAIAGYDGYKPLTPESAVTSAPDVILATPRTLATTGGLDGLLEQPGLALTPAGRSGRVIIMDDLYLLGFGPRAAQAALELARQIHRNDGKQ